MDIEERKIAVVQRSTRDGMYRCSVCEEPVVATAVMASTSILVCSFCKIDSMSEEVEEEEEFDEEEFLSSLDLDDEDEDEEDEDEEEDDEDVF